ncbi:MAG: alginate export family protein [Saprospiraceae bacterium]|nr:alginate export family protein [Saprospiraceae bacterium]
MLKTLFTFILILGVTHNSGVEAQSTPELPLQDSLLERPAFKLFRAEENYDDLKDKENSTYKGDYLDPIKFIGLNASKKINLSFGGEIRLRMEDFTNKRWMDEAETFYSHRIALHSNVNVSKYLRFFGELYHGLLSLEQKEFAQSDPLDWHQGFLEIKIPIENKGLSLRFGRQEIAFGATRLIGIREGPNIRRSFDMGRAIIQTPRSKTELFYGKEVQARFEVFDNNFSLFSANAQNPKLWGIYSQFALLRDVGKIEVYYLGFQSPQAFFNDAAGEDQRHTIGIRRFGQLGKKLRYNTEVMFQFGETGGKNARGWAFETDWTYRINDRNWQPEVGLKLDVISGDKSHGDNRIQTFNPLFTNPAYFSLAGIIAPVNLIEFHPSISMRPNEQLQLYLEWASFFRYSMADGVYAPPRFIMIAGQLSTERFIGSQLGCKMAYEFDQHFSFDFNFSYFITGSFLESTGRPLNMIHIAPTLTFKY